MADTIDLGSIAKSVQVQVLSSARRAGSGGKPCSFRFRHVQTFWKRGAYMNENGGKSISLKEINFYFLILAILVSGVLSWSMYRTEKIYNQAQKVTQDVLRLENKSQELQKASDYLTEQMRLFAATGRKEYLDNYFEEANVTKRRDDALNTLKEEMPDSPAVKNLNTAMEESVELMDLEYYAAALTVKAYRIDEKDIPEVVRNIELDKADLALSEKDKRIRASEVLFSDEYLESKEVISKNITKCLDALSAEMEEEQLRVSGELKKQVAGEHVLTIVLIVIMLCVVLLTFALIIQPLQKCVELIRDEKSIPLKGAYEIKFLAKTYNFMYNLNMASKEQLTYDATHDQLTGLYNRRGYDLLVQNTDLETSTLIIMDLDNSEEMKDNYGAEVAEKVLKKTADTIFKNFRSHDYVCRMDGDEFAILLMHVDSDREELIQSKILAINEKLKNTDDGLPAITISAGINFGKDGMTAEDFLSQASDALMLAKKKGKGESCIYKL